MKEVIIEIIIAILVEQNGFPESQAKASAKDCEVV